MEKFLIWKAKNSSFTKNFGQNIRFVPYDTIATSEHTVTDIQVAPFRGCLLLRLTDYLYDSEDESVRKILKGPAPVSIANLLREYHSFM